MPTKYALVNLYSSTFQPEVLFFQVLSSKEKWKEISYLDLFSMVKRDTISNY